MKKSYQNIVKFQVLTKFVEFLQNPLEIILNLATFDAKNSKFQICTKFVKINFEIQKVR